MSKEVLRTEMVYLTNTIKLMQAGKEYQTTLLNPVGLTTVTDYKQVITTLPHILPHLPTPPSNQPMVPQQPLGLGLAASVTIVSSPVTKTTMVTMTETQEYKIRFRNKPIVTTVTNTKVVSTVLTSYITHTSTIQPATLLG